MPDRPIVLASALDAARVPHVRGQDEPAERRLRVYARDPTVPGSQNGIATLSVPFEPLGKNGSALFAFEHGVVASDASGIRKLNRPDYALRDGAEPGSDPMFMTQMVYAVAMTVHTLLSRALGRPSRLPFPHQEEPMRTGAPPPALRLRLRLDARLGPGNRADGNESPQELVNAYYDPAAQSVCFGMFTAADALGTTPYSVHTALSADVVAHELTHALLDGERPYLGLVTSVETAALNEGLADVVALFLHFRHRALLTEAIERMGGDLSDDLIRDLAREFGRSIDPQTRALRQVIVEDLDPDKPPPADAIYNGLAEPHALGSVLCAAVFSAFRRIYLRRMHLLRKVDPGEMSRAKAELAAERLSSLAEDFLNFALRGIDYLPPMHVTFSDYLRAVVTADYELNPDDPLGFREALIEAFRRFRIPLSGPNHFNVESVRWPVVKLPDPAWPRLAVVRPVAEVSPSGPSYAADRKSLGESVATWLKGLQALGDSWSLIGLCNCPHSEHVETTILSADLARRRGFRDQKEEFVVQVVQRRQNDTSAHAGVKIGGTTLIFDARGSLRYAIHNPLCRVTEPAPLDDAHTPALQHRALGAATWPRRDRARRSPLLRPGGDAAMVHRCDDDFAQRLESYLAGPGQRYADALREGRDATIAMKQAFLQDTHEQRFSAWFEHD